MTERIFARQINHGLWQWRLHDKYDWKDQNFYTGDAEAMVTSVDGRLGLPVQLMLQGASCVAREEVAETTNRRTLAKLLPYDLEDDIIDPIDELHFGFGEIDGNNKVSLIYTRADHVASALQKIEDAGCDVHHISPDYLWLKREHGEMVLLWDEDQIMVHHGHNQGCTLQADIAQFYLSQLEIDPEAIDRITLIAASADECEEMKTWLPAELFEDVEVISQEGGFWDSIDVSVQTSLIELRSGEYARQLPLYKWWNNWKLPVYFAAAAIVFAMLVNFALLFEAKSEYRKILETRKQVFLQAIPGGRTQTPERTLKAELGGDDNKSAASNFMLLLEGVSKTVNPRQNVTMGSLRYSGDQLELIISFEVNSIGEVENIRTEIEKLGFKAETLRAAAEGNVYQARVKISKAGAAS